MNIDTLKGQFKDYARANLFYIRFVRPKAVNIQTGSLFDRLKGAAIGALKSLFDVPEFNRNDMIDLAIKSSKFPSIGINTADLEFRGFKMPTVGPTQLGEFEATFICDYEMIVYQYFVAWIQEIINPTSGIGISKLTESNAVDAFIYQIQGDLKAGNGYTLTLHKVYPINISEIALSEEDNFMEFTVQFKYTSIENEVSRVAEPKSNDSLLDKAKRAIGGLI